MEVRKIVITGGAGFIGSHVVERVAVEFPNADISIIDKMTYAADVRNINHLLDWTGPSRVKLHVGDICDPALCRRVTERADLVLHLAAESHVDNSFGNSVQFTLTNTLGTHTLLEACRLNKIPKIIHVSTDEVYGEIASGSHTETDLLMPTNPYSASKAGADMIAMGYIHSYRLPLMITRANNIFGIRQYPEKLIPRFAMLGYLNKKMTIHGTGLNTRRFLDARDFAEALIVLIEKGKFGEVYNVGTDQELSVLSVTELICSHLGLDSKTQVTHVTDRLFNDSRYAVDSQKLRALGWSPRYNLLDELPGVLNWYKSNVHRYASLFEFEE